MAFPVPGDTGVKGFVLWYNSAVGCGQVEAFASLYGTPDYIEFFYSDPNRFTFSSETAFAAGDQVTFDVAQGTYAPVATNVAAA